MSQDQLAILDKFRDISSQKWIPLQASLELTNRCNERCGHCYIPEFRDDPRRILTQENWFHILEELRGAGTLFLILMGGEAMLNPHFWAILEKSSELHFHTSMISNGLKIQKIETAQKLKDLGLKNLTISLYSLTPEIHDKMTKVKGSHQKTMTAIDLARAVGLEVTLNALLTKDNIDGIFELEDWALEKNLSLKTDAMITPKLDGGLEPTELRASYEQLKNYYEVKIKKWPNARPKSSGESFSSYTCNAGKGKCAVTAYGELLPCIEVREPLGNLLEKPFTDLWFGEKVQKWRHLKWKDIEGVDEKTISFCDHCPGMAKNETGSPNKTTCFSKNLAKIKSDLQAGS